MQAWDCFQMIPGMVQVRGVIFAWRIFSVKCDAGSGTKTLMSAVYGIGVLAIATPLSCRLG